MASTEIKKMPTIGIIGNGVVGSALAHAHMDFGLEVSIWDKNPAKAVHTLENTLAMDLIFVCLPTPADHAGAFDYSALDDFFDVVQDSDYQLVLKSTVGIGTTKRMQQQYKLRQLVYSPEFLTERNAHHDANFPKVNILGLPVQDGMTIPPEKMHRHNLFQFYARRYPDTPVMTTYSNEAEAIKLFQNAFFAVKIAAFNELRSFADHLGIDWGAVHEGMLLDGRISPLHTEVPGPDDRRGFGGRCLPKDLSGLIQHYIDTMPEDRGFPDVLTAADCRNKRYDRNDG
jgi:UDPglucose 6-dehydrogenase